MPESKHMYLPEGGSINQPEVAGVWHGYDRKLLLELSKGIAAGQGPADRGVSSVPDAWARPLVFQNALRPNSGHPLRGRVLQEWRGLLSLLALHDLYKYNVDVVAFSLGHEPKAGEPNTDGAAHAFMDALRRLRPASVALEDGRPAYDWGDTLLIRFNKIPVGAFSPTTLVYTAADYRARLATTRLHLKDSQGFLAPPTAAQHDDLRYVATWVEQLYRRLNARDGEQPPILHTSRTVRGQDDAASDPVSDTVGTINSLLVEWLRELRRTLGVADDGAITSDEVEVAPEMTAPVPAAPFLKHYRVYQALLHPLRRAPAREGVVDSGLLLGRLRTRGERQHVVVITPALLESGRKIWQSRRLIHFGGDAEAAIKEHFGAAAGWGVRIEPDDMGPAAMWIRPERYFLTDTLATTADGRPLLASDWQPINGEAHLLLPFTARILDFFSPVDIRRTLKPRFEKVGNDIRFTFDLPVGDAVESITRLYRDGKPGPDEGRIEKLRAVPPVQLFPRYIDRHWRRYYVLQGGADAITVQPLVEDPDSCRIVARTHATEGGPTARAVEVAGDGAFPEALVFAPAGRDDGPLGLALVPPPAEPPTLDGRWTVGIDFGTSNTNVFRKSDDAVIAERWRFNFDAYLSDVTVSDEAQRNAALRAYFVPPHDVELPVPTALRVFEESRKEHLLLDYFLYVPSDFPTDFELPRNVHTNFKWEEEGDEAAKTSDFLGCLLLLVLIEAGLQRIEQVDLACSYPKAFTVERRKRFQDEWGDVVERLLDGPDAVLHRRDGRGKEKKMRVLAPAFDAEGVAAGEFFASPYTIENPEDRAKTSIAAVCLDVGGATTDISIWHRNAIVFDASVLLAGRQVARLLQQNTGLADLIFTPEAANALFPSEGSERAVAERAAAERRPIAPPDRRTPPTSAAPVASKRRMMEPPAFAARLNIVLKQDEQDIRKQLRTRANNPEVHWIRRVLAVEFGAIAFYTVTLLGAADRALGGGLADEMKTSGIALHWGGNAAKLINWIDYGRYDRDGVASQLLNEIVRTALEEMQIPAAYERMAQRQSPGHKSEAAGGLVVIEQHEVPSPDQNEGQGDARAAAPRRTTIVCGEDIELVDGPVGHLDAISEQTLFDGNRTRFKSTSLTRLSMFVDLVNRLGMERGLLTGASKIRLDEARRIQIADEVRAHFIVAERSREGRRVIEPVFILEVKILMDYLQRELR